MSEPIWCNINIATPATWPTTGEDVVPPPGFVAGVLLDDDGLINGERDVSIVDGRAVWWWSGEGNYGLWDDAVAEALNWCEANAVPYIATSDTKYDMTGEIRVFNGTELLTGEYNEGVVLTEAEYRSISQRSADPGERWFMVEAYFSQFDFDIQAASIEHLPATPPKEEEP